MSRSECYMKLGHTQLGYPAERNFLHTKVVPLDESGLVEWTYCPDHLLIVHKLAHRFFGVGYSKTLESFVWASRADVELLHLFNSIPIGSGHFVVTFETSLPREINLPRAVVRWVWSQLAGSRCLAVLALSDCAKERLLCDIGEQAMGDPEIYEKVRAKVRTLHPPQRLLTEGIDENLSGPLRLVIVGHDFYRKGGLEVLRAMELLVAEGKDVRLSIVGKMAAGDYASRAGEDEVAKAEKIIESLGSRIVCRGSLPPEEVVNLLRQSDVLCLPTWGETYGYSVLEGQAAGCPAITTNIRALPEINSEACGWVVEVPKLKNGDADIDTVEKRERFRAILIVGLVDSLRSAYDNRSLLQEKAQAGLERIRMHHDPEAHARELISIYKQKAPI